MHQLMQVGERCGRLVPIIDEKIFQVLGRLDEVPYKAFREPRSKKWRDPVQFTGHLNRNRVFSAHENP